MCRMVPRFISAQLKAQPNPFIRVWLLLRAGFDRKQEIGVVSAYRGGMISRTLSVFGAVLASVAFFWGTSPAQAAAAYCVRSGATGSGNGSDWNNAYPALPATLQRGATYYVAAGTYGSYTFTTPVSGTNYITIKKATAAEHGTDVGWVSTYGTGQAVWNAIISFVGTSYFVFDGATRNEADWSDAASYGFRIANNGQIQEITMRTTGSDMSNIQVKNCYVEGSRASLPSATVRYYNIDIYDFGTPGNYLNILISRCFIQYGNVPVFCGGVTGSGGVQSSIFEYCLVSDNVQNTYNHGSCFDFYYSPSAANTVRYNVVRNFIGTAVVSFTQNDGFEIYGNVLWNCETGDGSFGFNGNSSSNNKIYNNTIVDAKGYNSGVAFGSGANNLVYNNLWINDMTYPTSVGFLGGCTHDYNAFSDGDNRGEAHAQINVPTSVFVNYSGQNFRLASATAAGSPLASAYNSDMLGSTRGVDGVWDRGAYEYTGVASTNPPVLSGVNASSVTASGAVIGWTTDKAASSAVDYGTSATYGSSVSNSALVTSHSLALSGLSGNTTYHYRVRSTDWAGNRATSGDFTFQTAIADNTPPTIGLTSPANGSTVSNSVNLAATAADNVGVQGVRFFVNGVQVADVTASPYACSWDSASVTNGSYRLYAQARDGAGNVAWSSTNTITINNPPVTLPGPAAYWTFNEGTGTVAADSASTNALTLRTGASWAAAGRFGGGLALDGISGRADAPNSPSLDLKGSNLTVAAWVNLQDTGNWQQLLAKVKEVGAFTAPYWSWHLFGASVSSTQWRPQFQTVNDASNSVNVSSSLNANYGEWVHVAGVYDGAAVHIYVNGVEQGNAPQTGNLISYNQPLYIGASGMPDYFAKGTIDEVRVYAQALSAGQVLALYNLNVAQRLSPPVPPAGLHVVATSNN